jgi:hypothetical protein
MRGSLVHATTRVDSETPATRRDGQVKLWTDDEPGARADVDVSYLFQPRRLE